MSDSHKRNKAVYIKIPPKECSSFRKELTLRITNIKSGPEPHFTNLQQFYHEFSDLSNDDLLTKWCALLYIMNSVPKCGARVYVSQILDLCVKIRLWSIRLATVMPRIQRTISFDAFRNKITELISLLTSNNPTDTNMINYIHSIIVELRILVESIFVDPPQARVFLKFESFIPILDELAKNIKILQELFVFADEINSISACFNKYTCQPLDSIQIDIRLNIESDISNNTRIFTGKMRITNEERNFILNSIVFLSQNDIKVSDIHTDANCHQIYPANLEKIFSSLMSYLNLESSRFSHDFITAITNLVRKPNYFDVILFLLSELTTILTSAEIEGINTENINGLTDQLNIICQVHEFYMVLDYLSICPYKDSIYMMYIRTLSSIAFKKDVFIPILTQKLKDENIILLKKQIQSMYINGCDGYDDSVFKNIRKNFINLVKEYFVYPSENSFPLLQFLLDVDMNRPNEDIIPDFRSLFPKTLRDSASQLSNIGESLIKYQEYIEEHQTCYMYLNHLIETLKTYGIIFNKESKKILDNSELMNEFTKTLLFLIQASVLPGLNESDLDFLAKQDDPDFVNKFIQFIKSLSIDHRFLTKSAVLSSQKLLQKFTKEKSVLMLEFDIMTRGALDINTFKSIVSSNILSKNRKVVHYLIIFIILFRLFNLRDEIINIMVETTPSIKNENVLMNSLKHFNKKRFIDGFSNIITFIYTFTDTDNSSNSEFLHNILDLTRLNNIVPDFFPPSQTQAYEIDTAFLKITTHLDQIKIHQLLGKIQSFVRTLDTENLGANACSDFFICIERFMISPTIQNKIVTKIGNFVAKLVRSEPDTPVKASDYIISFFNTISIYKNLIPSIYAYICFLLSNRSSINLTIPLLLPITTKTPDEFKMIPLQFYTGAIYPEFQTCTNKSQIAHAQILSDDTSISNDISNLLFDDNYLLPVESQNIILNSIQSYGQENKLNKLQNPNLAKLCDVRRKLMQARKDLDETQKIRKVSYIKNQNELIRLKKELFSAYEAYQTENSQLELQIEDFKTQIQAYEKSIENKKKLIENLKQQISTIKSVDELKVPVMPERKQLNDKFTAKISEFRIPEEKPTEIPEINDIFTSPEHVEEDVVEIPPVQEEIPQNQNKIIQEIEEFVETPASLRNLIGDKWPSSMQNSISNTMKKIYSSDSVKAMRFLKDASPDSISKMKNSLSSSNVDLDESLVQNDLMRRISIINEMFGK